MSLDPDAERVLEMIRVSGRPVIQSLSPQEAREVYRASKALTPDPPDVAQVDDLVAPGPGGAIPLRMYRGVGSSGKLPVLVFFHGGGFCIGDLDTHDYVCRYIANCAGCAVISVGYRLAPEHKFPAAVDDCVAAVTRAARIVIAEQQQHPVLNIAMVNQVEDQRDEKNQSFADHGRQHGEDLSYNIGRGQVDGTLVRVSAGHLRERIADLVEERERISHRLQAFLEERTKFTPPSDPVGQRNG